MLAPVYACSAHNGTLMPEIRQKTCSRCGGPFDCCTSGCWCEDITLDPATRAAFREEFTDCLCPTCLKAAADGLRGLAPSPEETREAVKAFARSPVALAGGL